MTRTFRLVILFTSLLAIFTTLTTGCGNNGSSTGSGGNTGTITVLIVNENGDPISGGEVFTEPASLTVAVDENGRAILSNIPVKQYNVRYSRHDIPQFGKFVRLDEDPEQTIELLVVSAITISVTDELERAISSTIVKTFPETEQVVTDSEGKAILHNIPIRQYSFSFERPNLPIITNSVILNENNYSDLVFTIESEIPVPDIISPQDSEVFAPHNVTFEGRGTDYEDGDIPGDNLKWNSNLDGDLGYGKTLTVPQLTSGNHIIRLTAEDYDGKTDTTTISIVIVNYNPESYFPMLKNSNWIYRFQTPVFSVVNNNNVTEIWNMSSMEVTLNESMNRTTTILYDITRGSVTEFYRYVLMDYLEEENGTVFISRTTESMSIWRPGEQSSPFYRFTSQTTYEPRYILIKNITQPDAEDHYDIEVRAETAFSIFSNNKTSGPFNQSFFLPVTFTYEGSTLVQTDQGILQAVKLKLYMDTEEPSTRHLWLTRGVGIVSMDFDTFGDRQTVVLTDSNILKYYRTQKSIPDTGEYFFTSTYAPVHHLNIDYRDDPLNHIRFVRSFAR